MALPSEPYLQQVARWPSSGRHILAQADGDTVIVYQAYRASTARYALDNGAFGGPEFSFSRMSWIKPNFLWMMYRSAWATSQDQEVVLGLRLGREFFEHILRSAVISSYVPGATQSRADWQARLASSDVRIQWDPDHDPSGKKLERRAIQLGLRGDTLRAYGKAELRQVVDMTPFIVEQRQYITKDKWALLRTPREAVYVPTDAGIGPAIGLDAS
jgi:hypothetical protein